MNKNERQVLKSVGKLADLTNIVDERKHLTVDYSWDAHHCNNFIVSDTIGDYQVFRLFDVEIEPDNFPLEKARPYLSALEVEKIENDEADLWETLENHWGEIDLDAVGFEYDFEIGECAQCWLNMKTGEVVYLGKIFTPDPRYFDLDKKGWQVVSPSSPNPRKRIFFEHRLADFFCVDFYLDHAVHPLLLQRGYDGIDAACYSLDEEKPEELEFYQSKQSWTDFIYSFVEGNDFERIVKPYGKHTFFTMYQYATPAERNEYLAAVRIATRHGYDINADRSLWDDLVQYLIFLGKDTHSPHYVCPSDLQQMHQQMHARYLRQQKAIQRRKQAEEAMQQEADYAKRIGKYLGTKVITDKFAIYVCPTIAEMDREGTIMHHCVFQMKYYERNCLIVLTRDKWGASIATSEISLSTWEIAQTRGNCNQPPFFNGEPVLDEINALIRQQLIPQLKAAAKGKKAKKAKKQIATAQAAAPAQDAAAA